MLVLNWVLTWYFVRPKQTSGCSMKKGALRNFTKFIGKHLRQSLYFNKDVGLSPATSLKTRLSHRSFPVNFAKFLRITFIIEHLWWLLLVRQEIHNLLRGNLYLEKKKWLTADFANWMFFLVSDLMGEINLNPEVLSVNT